MASNRNDSNARLGSIVPMVPGSRYRQLPVSARGVGFELETAPGLEVQPGPGTVRVCERVDGKTIGELEIVVFQAPLVIDRDGVLERKVIEVLEVLEFARSAEPGARVAKPVPVSLPGASGVRAAIEIARPMGSPRPPFPYLYVFAIAPLDLAVNAGVVIRIRCAVTDWPAGNGMLRTLRLLGRGGKPTDGVGDTPAMLPMLGKRDD
jgi:hypothetical protein